MKFKHQSDLMKKIRKESGFSQVKLANTLGVHVQNISNIERGISGITIRIARALSKLGVRWKRIQLAAMCDYKDQWQKDFFGKNGKRSRIK